MITKQSIEEHIRELKEAGVISEGTARLANIKIDEYLESKIFSRLNETKFSEEYITHYIVKFINPIALTTELKADLIGEVEERYYDENEFEASAYELVEDFWSRIKHNKVFYRTTTKSQKDPFGIFNLIRIMKAEGYLDGAYNFESDFKIDML